MINIPKLRAYKNFDKNQSGQILSSQRQKLSEYEIHTASNVTIYHIERIVVECK